MARSWEEMLSNPIEGEEYNGQVSESEQLNTYSQNNVCVKCKREGEVIYHQYLNSFSCQWCGKWWNNE